MVLHWVAQSASLLAVLLDDWMVDESAVLLVDSRVVGWADSREDVMVEMSASWWVATMADLSVVWSVALWAAGMAVWRAALLAVAMVGLWASQRAVYWAVPKDVIQAAWREIRLVEWRVAEMVVPWVALMEASRAANLAANLGTWMVDPLGGLLDEKMVASSVLR